MYPASRFASPALKAKYRLSGPWEVLAAAESLARLAPDDIIPSGSKEIPLLLLPGLEIDGGILPM